MTLPHLKEGSSTYRVWLNNNNNNHDTGGWASGIPGDLRRDLYEVLMQILLQESDHVIKVREKEKANGNKNSKQDLSTANIIVFL